MTVRWLAGWLANNKWRKQTVYICGSSCSCFISADDFESFFGGDSWVEVRFKVSFLVVFR